MGRDLDRDNDMLNLLMKVLEEKKYLNVVLEECRTERHSLSYTLRGAVENRIFIDYVIDSYSKTPVVKMKPVIRNILRLGTFQILFSDSMPDHAAVNEAVKLTKKRGFTGLSGFVNGVLRTVSREKENILSKETEPRIRYSMPDHIYDMWTGIYGEDRTIEICKSFLTPSAVTLRVNTLKISTGELAERLGAERVIEPEYALRLKNTENLTSMYGYKEGLFYIQDITSMMVCEKAGIKKDMKILDICSAPGGKSIDAALLMEGTGQVISRDISDKKADIIKENISRLEITNIKPEVKDAAVLYKEDIEAYDTVIADLPCSGLGIIGKKPDIKYRITEQEIISLQKLQREILDNAVRYVKRGGRLVFSTCTISPKENEDNTEWIREKYPDMRMISEEQYLPESGRNDGFFISVFEKG